MIRLLKTSLWCILSIWLMLALPIQAMAEETVVSQSNLVQGNPLLTNQVQDISMTSLSGGRLNVKLTLKAPINVTPPSFSLTTPPRIVFDIPKTANGLGKNLVNVNQGALKTINIAQAKDRSRLVFNLTKVVPHQITLKDNQITIALQGDEATNHVSEAKFSEAKPSKIGHRINNVDFVRGKNGEGRVIVDLADANTGINIKNAGKTVVIDFMDTEVPEKLQRRLNVVNFNTPVLFVDTVSRNKDGQIIIEPKGDWEQSAYQADKKFIIDIRPVVQDPNKLVQGNKTGYRGEKLTLNFQKVEVRDVLKAIADFTGKNIVTSDSVTGNITIGLKDVPWDQALDVIMKNKGLDMRVNGNVISIAPAEEIAAKEKAILTAAQELETLETLRTEVFTLRYQKAVDFKGMLLGSGGAVAPAVGGAGGAGLNRILSARGSVTHDVRTNTIFVQDTPKKLEEVQAIINKVDVPVKQVMIESRMVIADDKFSKALGARFGVTQNGRPGNNSSLAVSGTLGNKITETSATSITLGNHGGAVQASTTGNIIQSSDGLPDLMSNLPVSNAFGSIALSLLKLSANTLLNLELSALESDGRGKVVSSPRVTTANQQKARIAQGVEIPYQTATSSGATAVSFKKAELSLEVTPQITPDQKIIMDLDVRKDSQGAETSGGVAINTQNVQTQVLVGNGETVVLGGIYEQISRNNVDKVPFFGDIPIVGNAFKRRTKQEDRSELLIFITPKIMDESLNLN